MRKIDIVISVIILELTAWYFLWLFRPIIIIWILPIIFPILGALGIWLAYLIGKRFLFVFQMAKFLLIGTLAVLVDLFILNILILISGISIGIAYSFFKGFSFIIATLSRYLGNKFWAFKKRETRGAGKEFGKFFIVTLAGLLINVFTASLIVNLIEPQFSLSEKIWANIAAIIAAVATVAWNFPAYKYLVFKK